MGETPLVSVIVPAYQARATLPRAVDSLLGHDYAPLEVVVVDDESPDDLGTLVTERYGGDPRVQYVRQEHAGPAAARNTGFARANGELIAFLDADDEWLPGKARKQVALLGDRPEIAAVGTYRVWVRADQWGRELSRHAKRPRGDIEEVSFGQQLRRNYICGASVMVRREVFERHGGYDEQIEIGEDRDLWLRILADGARIVNLAELLYVFYERPGSQRADLRKRLASHRRILAKWDPASNARAAELVSDAEYADIRRWWLLRAAARAARERETGLVAELVVEVRACGGRDRLCDALCCLGSIWPGGLALASRLGKVSRPT